MPGKITITVSGTREIEKAMKELGVQAAGRIARSALNRSGTILVKAAREKAPQPGSSEDPYATGLLRKSIGKRLRRQRQGSNRQSLIVGIERPVASRYAHLVEWGRPHQAAEPFLRPALDETAHEILRVQKQAMLEGIDREVRRLAVRALAKAGFRG